jgi:hypothetical protein
MSKAQIISLVGAVVLALAGIALKEDVKGLVCGGAPAPAAAVAK